jgi:Glycosyl transferases group 1
MLAKAAGVSLRSVQRAEGRLLLRDRAGRRWADAAPRRSGHPASRFRRENFDPWVGVRRADKGGNRPVISTYIAGIPELVVPGQTGWLVPSSDEAALAEAMREALTAPVEQLAAMGAAGHARIIENHDVLKEAKKLKSLIEAAEKLRLLDILVVSTMTIGGAFEIGRDGWRLIGSPPVRFRRAAGMLGCREHRGNCGLSVVAHDSRRVR